MTDVSVQRRIASEILKTGYHRVWVDEAMLSEISLAMTRLDVKKLINDGFIRQKQKKGISRGRARYRLEQKAKNQRRGPGRRKGAKEARLGRGGNKRLWIYRIRAQRRYLRALRETQQLDASTYRKYYRKAKGGQFRSVAYLRNQLRESGLIKEKGKRKGRGLFRRG